MNVAFPTDRDAKRRMLLRTVEDIADVLAVDVEEAERLRTLPPASVAALRDSGLYLLKFPAALGGAEADPVTQIEVIEAVSYISPAAGWCLAICADVLGLAGAHLPDATLDAMLSAGRPPMMAGTLVPGVAVPAPGGYRLTGRWSWGSGIRHAEWLTAQAVVEPAGGGAPRVINCYLPVAEAEIHDTWHVMGMQGTGSCDFSVSDLFIPEAFAYDIAQSSPRRGGAIYRMGWPGYVINVAAAAPLGMARRALDAILELAQTKRRGYGKRIALAERAVFQGTVAKDDLRLRAARALTMELVAQTWQVASDDGQPPARLQAEMRAAATLATDVAVEVATAAFRYGGGTAIFLDHVLQRCLRDLNAIATHLLASDIAYEQYGQFLISSAPSAAGRITAGDLRVRQGA
jgi:alkylation response protein AidB-like acyl-CoA dehydrogenase